MIFHREYLISKHRSYKSRIPIVYFSGRLIFICRVERISNKYKSITVQYLVFFLNLGSRMSTRRYQSYSYRDNDLIHSS